MKYLQLSEAVGLQSPSSPTMSPVGEDDPLGHPDSVVAMEEASPEVAALQQRLVLLEGDNAMLRASCVTLQMQLDQASLYSCILELRDNSMKCCFILS